jgi:uncharacterized protein related to proFAR isomerase
MSKSLIHLAIDTIVLERAKLNNINISKELEKHLERILMIKTTDLPTEKEQLIKLLNEKEQVTTTELKELNDIKLKIKDMELKEKEIEKQDEEWQVI